MVARLDTKEFIKRARIVHGENKYDYSKVDYVRAGKKLVIICPKHGKFLQYAANHLRGVECLKCTGRKVRRTTESFIEEAKSVHGEKYNYDQVIFIRTRIPVSIKCNTCQTIFPQIPSRHLQGHGCPICRKINFKKWHQDHKKTNKEFIQEAIAIHGDKYDYGLVDYKSSKIHISILCNTCQTIFQQLPDHHLNRKNGCVNCNVPKLKTIEQYIKEAKQKHGDKYDYSETTYKGAMNKLTINCPKHGYFEQAAYSHLHGKGCPKCGRAGYSQKSIRWLNKVAQENGIKVQHAENDGEVVLNLSGYEIKSDIYKQRLEFDGMDWENSTVYEFNGCYFHGCPRCFPIRNDITKFNHKTHEENYLRTMEKARIIEEVGFKLETMWECEFDGKYG